MISIVYLELYIARNRLIALRSKYNHYVDKRFIKLNTFSKLTLHTPTLNFKKIQILVVFTFHLLMSA